MHVILLLLGAIISAAGIALFTASVSAQGFGFGTGMVEPGAIAAVGGLIVISLGVVVRALQRIERALAASPSVRPTVAVAVEAPAVSATEQPAEPTADRLPVVDPRPVSPPQPTIAPPPIPVPADSIAFGSLRERFQTLAQAERQTPAETTVVPMVPRAPARVDEDAGVVRTASASGRANVATERSTPRLEVVSRPSGSPARPKISMFDSFWPKTRPGGAQAATAEAIPAPPVEPVSHSDMRPGAEPAAVAHPEPAGPAILKSGIVDGMAYTLYADGSIEAQLPQGTMRFRSITELRKYLDQSA